MVILATKESYGNNGGFRQLEKVKVAALDFLKENPANRALEANVQPLKIAVQISNKTILDALHVNGETMRVVEGNRRLLVARLLGIIDVWAWVYYKCSKAEMHGLFALLNLHKKAHTGAQKVEAELNGVVGATIKGVVTPLFGETSKATAIFRRLFDESELNTRKSAGQLSPSNLSRARSAMKFFKIPSTDEKELVKILRWMMDLNQSLALYSALTNSRRVFKITGTYNKALTPAVLRSYIERDVPIGATQKTRATYEKAMAKKAMDQAEESQLTKILKQAGI